MRYLIIILLLLSCNNKEVNIKSFENYLGKDKAESLNLAIRAWDDFVSNNRGAKSTTEFSFFFLQTLMVSWDSLDKWKVDCKQFTAVIDKIRKTDFEKEFWRYTNETYDDMEVIKYYFEIKNKNYISEPFDTIQYSDDFEEILEIPETEGKPIEYYEPQIRRLSSLHSKIISGIHKYSNDDFVREGAEITIEAGHLSPSIIIRGILENKERVDFSNYFTKAFIIQTIFYDFIYGNTCENMR